MVPAIRAEATRTAAAAHTFVVTQATEVVPHKRVRRSDTLLLPKELVLEIMSLACGLRLRELLDGLDDERRTSFVTRHRESARFLGLCVAVDRTLLRCALPRAPAHAALLDAGAQSALALSGAESLRPLPLSVEAQQRAPWQDPARDDQVRAAVLTAAARVLLGLRPFAGECWLRQFPHMLPRLELRLYSSAASRCAYADLDTLLPRMASIHRALCARDAGAVDASAATRTAAALIVARPEAAATAARRALGTSTASVAAPLLQHRAARPEPAVRARKRSRR